MIRVESLYKSFDGFQALKGLDICVRKGSIYGLVGTNGSGKTTVIKHITGVLRGDSGSVTIEGQPVYENIAIKERVGYIPDDLTFYNPYTLKEASVYFSSLYKNWDQDRYKQMLAQFGLPEKQRISRFSKGMQKQAAFILVMSTKPDYLILDEPIDGLDPIIRKLVWKYVVTDVAEREMTVLVSSHNLREMEGICDAIGILTKGEMKIERDLDELKADIHKVQVAFRGTPEKDPYEGLAVLHKESRGSVDLLIIRNTAEQVEETIGAANPAVFDMLPLSLEEIFIYELGGEGYDADSILF